MILLFTFCFLSLAWSATATAANDTFQPKDVITVEAFPSRMVFGSLSMPLGAPWCQGMPGYWLIGHQPTGETPWCLVPKNGTIEEAVRQGFEDYDFTNSTWEQNSPALLDTQDPLNDDDNRHSIDRHQCVAMDVNGKYFVTTSLCVSQFLLFRGRCARYSLWCRS